MKAIILIFLSISFATFSGIEPPTKTKKVGLARIHPINTDGKLKSRIYNSEKWSTNWRTFEFFEEDGITHQFRFHKSKKAKIQRHKNDGSMSITVYDKKWKGDWLLSRTYKVNGKNFLLHYRKKGMSIDEVIKDGADIKNVQSVKGSHIERPKIVEFYNIGTSTFCIRYGYENDANPWDNLTKSHVKLNRNITIHEMKSDGTFGKEVYVGNWSKDWKNFEFYSVKNQLYMFQYHKNGKVMIHKMNPDGKQGKRIYEKKWSEGWKHFEFYKIGNSTYTFRYHKNGKTKIHVMKSDGTQGGLIYEKQWTEGWSTAEIFYISDRPYLFIYKKEFKVQDKKQEKKETTKKVICDKFYSIKEARKPCSKHEDRLLQNARNYARAFCSDGVDWGRTEAEWKCVDDPKFHSLEFKGHIYCNCKN